MAITMPVLRTARSPLGGESELVCMELGELERFSGKERWFWDGPVGFRGKVALFSGDLQKLPLYCSPMAKKLFLLDGMALVYRAHFALIARPIFTSKGVNSSALYGFTQTLLEIIRNQQPTHLAVAFDTDAPTPRHTIFPDYKATRQAMPEDLSAALPHVRRM